jgi:probable rRNA maturation factor
MIIHITNSQRTLKISKKVVQSIVEAVIAFENQSCEEVSIHFITQARICELHALYFDDPSPTDCISFPLDESPNAPYRVLGEIFVCPQVAKEYASQHQTDAYKEITLYIIHGLLHLMGYNDIDVNERAEMRKAEKRHEKNLKQLQLNLGS